MIGTDAFLALAGMALATYFTRAGGLWLINRVTVSQRMEQWLNYLPGTILVSLLAPIVVSGDRAELIAIAVTILVGVYSKNILLTMGIGIAAVWLLRNVL